MTTINRLLKSKLFSYLFLCSFLLFSACNNNDTDPENTITDEDAREVIESSFTFGTQGLTDGIFGAALVATIYSTKGGNNDFCGVAFDSTLTINISRPVVTANYSTSFGWTVNCNNVMIPQSLDFERTASGSYETDRSSANNQVSSSWTISNLAGGDNWAFNGTYMSSGMFISKVGNQNQWNNTFSLSLNQVEVSKSTYQIVSGGGSFSLLLSDGEGNSRNFEGTITFLGNAMATITLNGTSFDVDWS